VKFWNVNQPLDVVNGFNQHARACQCRTAPAVLPRLKENCRLYMKQGVQIRITDSDAFLIGAYQRRRQVDVSIWS
jgi:hypothetical protein